MATMFMVRVFSAVLVLIKIVETLTYLGSRQKLVEGDDGRFTVGTAVGREWWLGQHRH